MIQRAYTEWCHHYHQGDGTEHAIVYDDRATGTMASRPPALLAALDRDLPDIQDWCFYHHTGRSGATSLDLLGANYIAFRLFDRPELFQAYVNEKPSMVLTDHYHIRLHVLDPARITMETLKESAKHGDIFNVEEDASYEIHVKDLKLLRTFDLAKDTDDVLIDDFKWHCVLV
jgi:hypothetical protein